MRDENYARVRQTYEDIVDQPQERWQVLLDEKCRGDASLRQDVQLMLDCSLDSADFLEKPILAAPQLLLQIIEQYDNKEADYTGKKLKNRYVIESLIGKGGFGMVYRGRDEDLHGRLVVIKVIKPSPEVEEWLAKRFRLEVETLSKLDHDGVVGILDAGQTPDGRPFLVMRYVEGATLRTLIAHRPIPFERAVSLIKQLSDALDTAHRQGILHRDLKPENIIIRDFDQPSARPVIIDFGIASIRQPDQREPDLSMVVGSRPYMALEQLNGRPLPASDIFALGAIAYEMLTGRKLADDRAEGTFAALPEPAAAAIRRATLDRPAERFSTASEFAAAFSTRQSQPRFTRRTMLLTSLGIGACGLAAVAGSKLLDPGAKGELRVRFLQPSRNSAFPLGEHFPVSTGAGITPRRRMRLSLSSRTTYFLYVVSEHVDGTTKATEWHTLFPDPGRENAKLKSGEELNVPDTANDWLQVPASNGRDIIWVVCAETPVKELEELRRLTAKGIDEISGSLRETVEQLFAMETASVMLESDSLSYRVRPAGSVLVHAIRFKE